MLFEKASKLKLRFPIPKGEVTVEDVWDLPLTSTRGPSLNMLAKKLNRLSKDAEEESFVEEIKSKANTILELKFNIVKHIIEVKLKRRKAREDTALRKDKKEKLLGIIADKEMEGLKATSLSDLQKMVEDL